MGFVASGLDDKSPNITWRHPPPEAYDIMVSAQCHDHYCLHEHRYAIALSASEEQISGERSRE